MTPININTEILFQLCSVYTRRKSDTLILISQISLLRWLDTSPDINSTKSIFRAITEHVLQ